ncbi:GNAT family N-acetyltransferase [Salinibius halmophilus]|uniref:GNAT family N-acetyltransferase n=1 Tax=Salinibius halmophilus TaxID=1853216 RepID=UPI001314CEFB|nr:GNAT family N-acetyltransferase [Salinibius halmophilus]
MIRQGSLAEALSVASTIPEFYDVESMQDLSARLHGRRHLILVAEVNNSVQGFMIAYERDPNVLLGYLCGVDPASRRLGIATSLLSQMSQWAQSEQFDAVEMRTSNGFTNMIQFLLSQGFYISELKKKSVPSDHRVYLSMPISY